MELVSPYIIAALAGWFVAHLVKFFIQSFTAKELVSWRVFFNSGRMPSSHSATTVALLTVIAALDGVQSGLFGVAALLSGIVMFDAMKVRRSSGEQGVALTALLKEQKSKVPLPRVALGHTPLEVAVGALLGVVVGIVVASFWVQPLV